MMFKITKTDDNSVKNVRKRMKYYGKANDSGRAKVWKDSHYVELNHPHTPFFVDSREYRPSKNKLVLRHYPFRSINQAKAKVRRVKPSKENPFFWNVHYIGIDDINSIICKSEYLNYYNEDGNWKFDKVINSDSADVEKVIGFL